jgi:hypothetical protein
MPSSSPHHSRSSDSACASISRWSHGRHLRDCVSSISANGIDRRRTCDCRINSRCYTSAISSITRSTHCTCPTPCVSCGSAAASVLSTVNICPPAFVARLGRRVCRPASARYNSSPMRSVNTRGRRGRFHLDARSHASGCAEDRLGRTSETTIASNHGAWTVVRMSTADSRIASPSAGQHHSRTACVRFDVES